MSDATPNGRKRKGRRMSPHRRTMGQISLLTFLLVVLFVAVSVVYAQLGFTDLATASLGAATGIAVGAGASATVVHRVNGTPASDTDEEADPM